MDNVGRSLMAPLGCPEHPWTRLRRARPRVLGSPRLAGEVWGRGPANLVTAGGRCETISFYPDLIFLRLVSKTLS